MEFIDRFFNPPEGSFFLSFSARPERLEEMVYAKSGQKHFVIDEIQRVPELLKEGQENASKR
jgi:hypothetical protein